MTERISFMENIISQNFKNILKNKIKNSISSIISEQVYFLVDNLFVLEQDYNKYFSFISSIQETTREIIRNIIISTFEELDYNFKIDPNRVSRYYINKSNVSRTLITIVGEISFKRTLYINRLSKELFFFVDKAFDLPKYDHYDPIVKGIAVSNATNYSQAQSSRIISSFINDIKFFVNDVSSYHIPRQSIFNWLKNWHTPDVIPESIDTPDAIYIMADEKYIGAQDTSKDIMVKSFVVFEGVQDISKGRRALINRFVFSHYGEKAWPAFMDAIAKRYDFSKIENIALLSDGASWIKSGIPELKLDPINKVKFYLCEFHFKQAIHHITSNEDERKNLLNIFQNNSKDDFISAVNKIIENDSNRADIITKKLNYIINNYGYIKSMLKLKIGSSMESHISHLIASFFASRPKGFSTKRIKQYLKLNDYKNNNINIFKLYMLSYNNTETITINQEKLDFSIFEKEDVHNIPILNTQKLTPTYQTLDALAHPTYTIGIY